MIQVYFMKRKITNEKQEINIKGVQKTRKQTAKKQDELTILMI